MMDKQRKIFVITQPDVVDTVGGAISVFINFCNMLADNNYEVVGICYNKKQGCPQKLNDKVNFVNLAYYYDEDLSFEESINKFVAENTPDLLVFFFHYLYINANLTSKFDSIPRILMFHSRPDFYFEFIKGSANNLKRLYKNTVAQVLFPTYKSLLPDFIKTDKVVCIPNSVPVQQKTVDTSKENKKIIYLSRIDNCKGLEFLINSFKVIAKKYKDWSIDIYGQAQPEDYLQDLIKLTKKLKLENQIHFKGVTNEPIETFLNYDFCVFPSYFEGFPVGLIEAQSVGLPCIGLQGCTGVNELIIDGYNGFLTAENYKDYAAKIEKLIQDKELRCKFSENSISNAKQYLPEKINEKWIKVIEAVISNNLAPVEIEGAVSPKVFPIKKIVNMAKNKKIYSLAQRIFSVSNDFSNGHKRKVVCLLGVKFKLKKRCK